jgi:uncharacterized protein YcbK (DUF882 family)
MGLGLAVVLTVSATQGLQNAVANGDTRALTIHHTHTGENINVVFKRDGRYDDAGLAKLNRFLRDWRNHEETRMDPRLFDIVWEVYQDVGGREPIQIISAYRSPQTNSMLRRRSRGVAKHSQHMLGKAMDFNIPGVSLEKIRNAGLRQQRGGVGFYPSSGSPFVHLDVGSVRHWPRLSPEALARVFPDGKTVHLPTTGQPLRGYALALADVSRRGSGPAAPTGGADETPAAFQKPGWFARMSRMFTGAKDEDEDAGEQRNNARSRTLKPQEKQVASTQGAATYVPMPRARPASQPVASSVATAPATPAQIIQARGFWGGSEAVASETAAPKGREGGPRLVWQKGPQPAATSEVTATIDTTMVNKRVPAPRPRPVYAMAGAAETPASVPWPISSGREDRVPTDLMLAYAAEPPALTSSPSEAARTAPPMGSLRPAANTVRRPLSVVRPAAAAQPKATPKFQQIARPGPLGGNPWLRSVIVAPSIYVSVGVTSFGPPDYRAIARMMHKPSSAIANSFGDAPGFGLTPEAFRGQAVTFVPTVTFPSRTAGLN